MKKYIVINLLTNRVIGGIVTSSLRSAQCLSPNLFGYDRFNRVYEVMA